MPLSRLAAAALGLALTLAPAKAQEAGFRLLMVESPSCVYCRIFDRDIAPIYAVAPEGRAAPLIRMRLGAAPPEGVTLAYPPSATPTFVLLGPDGAERDRLIGYPGEDFFWGYIERMFARAGVPPAS
jgi:hypothetical protein